MAINAVKFLQEVKGELGKVQWPKFDEFIGSTLVVLFLVFCFSIFFGVVDFGLSKIVSYIFNISVGF